MSDAMSGQHFLELHVPGKPLLLANAWDCGSARVLEALGVAAVGTSSAGHAGTLGRLDGGVQRQEALEHARALAAATSLPVSADLENGFADSPEDLVETVELALTTGIRGYSIEDFTRRTEDPIYPLDLAAARIEAAVEASRGRDVVLTARCENYLHGRPDLANTIERLQAFQTAGAQVLFAPGLTDLSEIRSLVAAVDRPVNVLSMPGGPSVPELAEVGVARVSVGSAFFNVAMAALAEAARTWQERGTTEFWNQALEGAAVSKPAFD